MQFTGCLSERNATEGVPYRIFSWKITHNKKCLSRLGWAALFLGAVIGLPSSASAADWPEFRGPSGQGHVAGKLPLEWSTTKNVVWKQKVPGKGWSSPVLLGGRLYLTTAVPIPDNKAGDVSLEALCIDAASGKILWEKEVLRQDGVKAPRIHAKASHASPTPIVRDGRMYVHFGHQGSACLDLDGKVLWKNTSLRYVPIHGNGGSPILLDQALIFSCDGFDQQFVVALDAAKGEVRWKTPRKTEAFKKFSFSTPLVIDVKGQKQVISPGSDVVCSYDPSTGKELWRCGYEGYSVVPKPVFGHGLLFILCGFDFPTLHAMRADGMGDITKTHIAWSTKKAVPLTASLLLVGDELYMVADAGIASCLDARTGKVHWSERLGGNFSASPIAADGKICFTSEQGLTTVIQAGKEFKVLAKNNLEERTFASIAAADGVLFIRTEGHLYRIEEKK